LFLSGLCNNKDNKNIQNDQNIIFLGFFDQKKLSPKDVQSQFQERF